MADKVLVLADVPGWIIDRITDRFIRDLPFEFTKRYFTEITTDELVALGNEHDLVHYQNWDIKYHLRAVDEITTPFLLSIRSYRFPSFLHEIRSKVHLHVLNKDLYREFPEATFIPDGIFEQFVPHKPFIVGYAGKPTKAKGYENIEKACQAEGVPFHPATGQIAPEDMPHYFSGLDLYVCASGPIREGHSTPVMECLAMNVPVATTDVGFARQFDVYKMPDNSVESIRAAIRRFNSYSQVKRYYWSSLMPQYEALYRRLINAGRA